MKIAQIDLNLSRTEFESIDLSLIRKWGGGSGVASWRLYNEVGPDTDPLAPGNVVWIVGGPLTGTVAPCSGRLEVVTKSPLTGILGLSNTGGHFGARLKHAGVDGLVLRGVSKKPVYVLVGDGKIELRDASHLWGKDTWETEAQLGAELNDPAVKRIKVMGIGPAGEKLVRFACLVNERYHSAARGGAGAVLGSKRVKAIVVDTKSSRFRTSQTFHDAASKAANKIRENPVCQKYTRYGSLSVSDSSLDRGCLPGRNFQTGALDRWRETRGTERVMTFVTRPEASCYNCGMPCFNRVEVLAGEYEGLKISSGTFVQALLEFGAKCGIESPPAIWKCKEMCHRLGMDYSSAGGAIAFAMELFQRDLLSLADTGGISLSWGVNKQ